MAMQLMVNFIFFFNDTATTEIYTLSLHDALPISALLLISINANPTETADSNPAVRNTRLYDPSDGYAPPTPSDRKSTRLNSSHANISYAVFCLKKTTKT